MMSAAHVRQPVRGPGESSKPPRRRRKNGKTPAAPRLAALCLALLLLSGSLGTAGAFSLTEWLGFGPSDPLLGAAVPDSSPATLTMSEISELRVRDIKRRLSRHHGYGADELGRMLDKKELINALSYEEHKARQREAEERRRYAFRRSVVVALIVAVITTFWGLFVHVFEVAHVNFVVYTDKKKYEVGRCRDLRSRRGYLGVFLMFAVDVLSMWLTASVILSWVMRSKYFFPVPHIPIRPAALLAASTGGAAGGGPLSHYGVNVGPMAVTWALRFVHGRIEGWTGRALSDAQKRQRKRAKAEARAEAKRNETPLERDARRAARAARKAEKAARKAAAEAEEEARYAEWDRMRRAQQQSGGAASGMRRARQSGGAASGSPAEPPSGEEFRSAAETAAASNAEEQRGENDKAKDAALEEVESRTEDAPIQTGFDDID